LALYPLSYGDIFEVTAGEKAFALIEFPKNIKENIVFVTFAKN